MAEAARAQQVQRSARDAGVYAKDIRRAPQTHGDIRRRKAATLEESPAGDDKKIAHLPV